MELDGTLGKEFRLGDWVVRPIEGVVLGANESRHLQPKTMDVLVTLAESSGQVITRDELIHRVWGANAFSDEPLTRCIHELRRALDDDRGEPKFIQTIPKRGYRLLAEVRELEPADELLLENRGDRENPLRQVTRQRVLWVGLIYASLAWVFIQLARFAEQQASAELAPPDWLLPAFVATLLMGFPVAVFFAWFQQLKFDGFGSVIRGAGTLRCMRNLLWSRRGIDMILVTVVISVLAGFALDLVPLSNADSEGPAQFSIAVLPFASNGGAEDNWLGKGVAEDIHTRLAQGDALAVSSINGSFRESMQALQPQQIGHELNVLYVLRGLVIRGDETIRVKAYLVDAITGIEVWAHSDYREPAGLFAIEKDISNGVLAYFGVRLIDEGASEGINEGIDAANEVAAPMNMMAYEHYLRGRDSLRDAADIAAAADASEWFRQALAIDERMPMARSGLCQAYVLEMGLGGNDGVYGKANSACAEAILESPDSASAHLVLADFYRVSGHVTEAVTEYQWVVSREPDNSSAWYGLARAYAGSGSAGDAEEAFQRALAIKPDCADAHESYVAFLLQEGRYSDALELARQLVSLDSERVSGYELLARALFMNGEFNAAIKASREVLRRDIEHREAVLTIARSYYFLGRYQNAINIYTQAAKIVPDDHRAYGGLASAYAQRDDADSKVAARQNFARARYLAEKDLLIDGSDVNVMINLAYYCAALDDGNCAQRRLTEALEIAPGNVWVHYVAALVHARSGNMQAANQATRRARALGYPQTLLATDPLLASARAARRLTTDRFTALFVPASPANTPPRLPTY